MYIRSKKEFPANREKGCDGRQYLSYGQVVRLTSRGAVEVCNTTRAMFRDFSSQASPPAIRAHVTHTPRAGKKAFPRGGGGRHWISMLISHTHKEPHHFSLVNAIFFFILRRYWKSVFTRTFHSDVVWCVYIVRGLTIFAGSFSARDDEANWRERKRRARGEESPTILSMYTRLSLSINARPAHERRRDGHHSRLHIAQYPASFFPIIIISTFTAVRAQLLRPNVSREEISFFTFFFFMRLYTRI